MTVNKPRPEIAVGSLEFVKAEVAADVQLDDDVTVWIRLNYGEWLEAEWVGDVDLSRHCQTVAPVDFASWDVGLYDEHVRLGDSPESPILKTQGFKIIS